MRLFVICIMCSRPKPDRVYRTSEGAFIDDVYECDNPVPIPVSTIPLWARYP